MMNITDSASFAEFLQSCPYADLRELVRMRVEQLDIPTDLDFSDYAQFVIVGPGDALDDIKKALGFNPLANFVDGISFPHPDFYPSWEWVIAHGEWFETPFILSDDGFGVVLWVKDDPRVPADLLSMCKAFI